MKNSSSGRFARFLTYYMPYLKIIILDLLCAGLSTVCELVFPMIVRYITDTTLSGGQALLFSSVVRIGAVYLFLRLVDVGANYYMSNAGHVMGARMETDMRKDLFNHLQKLSFNYYDNAKVGQIMSRITSDLFDITEFAHHCPEEFFIGAIKIIGSFVILIRINVLLTVVIFLLLPLMFVSRLAFRKKMKRAFKEQREQIGELNAEVEDSLLGIRVVKSFANEDVEIEKFKKSNVKFLEKKKNAYKYMALFHSGTRLFDGIMYIAVIMVGALLVINGKISPGDLIAFVLYIQTLIASVRRVVEFTEQFERGITGIDRFCEIMEEPVDIFDLPDAKEISDVQGNITFKNISFKYSDNLENVLTNIDIDIKKGENIAVVGPSGGGKTTLCSLLPRFYDITDGEIFIDGVNIKDIKIKSLRENIGIVQQEVYMFSGSVFDNIAYGKQDATPEEVEEAAKAAGAHEFIMSLKDGYNTYVGERGVKLSGGQKQRISIARLFLKNPPILILDEATSALDNENELIVQNSLERLSKGRTTFTIAHRLTTIRNATRILVLTDEGIIEEGSHEELMRRDGEYAKLYKLYTR